MTLALQVTSGLTWQCTDLQWHQCYRSHDIRPHMTSVYRSPMTLASAYRSPMTLVLQVSHDISTAGLQWHQCYGSSMTSALQISMTSALQISHDISTTGFQRHQCYRSPVTSMLQFSNIPNAIVFQWHQQYSSPMSSMLHFFNDIRFRATFLQQHQVYSFPTTLTWQVYNNRDATVLQQHTQYSSPKRPKPKLFLQVVQSHQCYSCTTTSTVYFMLLLVK